VAAGVTFDERMRGFLAVSAVAPSDAAGFREAFAQGRRDGGDCHFEATMLMDDVAAYVRDPRHLAHMTGTFHWGEHDPMPMSKGEFQLHVKNPDTGIREMRYRFDFTGPGGEPLTFSGVKWLKPKWRINVWPGSTTLYSRIDRPDGSVGWCGVLTIGIGETLRLLRSIRPVGAADRTEGRRAVRAFNAFFMREQIALLKEG
jgi:cholesterol oxidase